VAHDPTQEDASETETINVVPLADLTLVLLVVLMVLSPMISQSMIRVAAPSVKSDKELKPEEKPPEDQKPPEPLMIAVNANGYSLNNVVTNDLEQLVAAVAARLVEEPERPVLVSADKTITVGAVVQVLDALKVKEPEVSQALGRDDFKIKMSLLKAAEPSAGKKA
jgi:biopolymer transport protein TolR